MKRTALYLRASSRDQIQHGFSIPDQLTRLRGEALTAGERIVAEFIDQARSGTSAAKRLDYQNLLAAARRHEFDRARFEVEDADGNQKSPVSVDTGRSLVPVDLLERVRVVELMPGDGP